MRRIRRSFCLVSSFLLFATGCGDSTTGTTGSSGATTSSAGGSTVSSTSSSTSSGGGMGGSAPVLPTKMDVLFVVDNSSLMASKQQQLAAILPDLLGGLLNPACVDANGKPVEASMQPEPTGDCPSGTTRDFPVITDVHLGMTTSSLGTFGASGCQEKPPASCSSSPYTPNDDHGHLVTRKDPCVSGEVDTYQSSGFVAWDPTMKLNPPGETSITNLADTVHSLVVGAGQVGCGFESQDEAWYRFLVDPTPYQSISLVNNQVQVAGTDSTLLDQRQSFLRPDSLVLIVDLSDETDTSIKQFSSYPLFAAPELHLPHPSSVCASNPKDSCCYSCGQSPPSGCTADPKCTSSPSYTTTDEDTSIRAFGLFSHKQRYGIEFFYQPSRYVEALTSETVSDVNDETVPNPLFAGGRSHKWVFYAPITGVPWQLIARQKGGKPDLVDGVSSLDPSQVGGFKSAKELALTDPQGNVFWDDIAGDPENYVAPKSPYMQESTIPRTGVDPITGIALSPPSATEGTDPINGHERTIKNPPDDIQYSCIFPLQTPIDCSGATGGCACPSSGVTDNPVCEGTMQVRDRAYPGLKQLAIAHGLGDQGIVSSICPKQVSDPTAADYGYRPAAKAIIDGVKKALRGD